MNDAVSSVATPDDDRTATTPNRPAGPALLGGLLELGQNYPNPHAGETTVPYFLAAPADVRLAILDAKGRRVFAVVCKGRDVGTHGIHLNLEGLALLPGSYMYELEATTATGVCRQSKQMSTE